MVGASYLVKAEPLVVPAGTELAVRLTTSLSSRANEPGDDFTGILDHPVVVEDKVAIPAGAEVTGTVVGAEASGRFKGTGRLFLTLTEVEVDGESYEVATTTTGRREGSKLKRNVLFIGTGAGLGTLIGGLAGGGKGAAIGAGVGAGSGTATAALTGQRDIRYPAETLLRFRLKEDLLIEQ
ncbi:MAG: hypothetical protein HYY26_04405 [Acidobacteria bacterium]|nr:hypothetical protein [Acidobacteriota bacterium]